MPTLLCGQRADPALGEWGKFQAVIQGVRWCVGPTQVVGMKTWKVQVAPLFNTRRGFASHITGLHRPAHGDNDDCKTLIHNWAEWAGSPGCGIKKS